MASNPYVNKVQLADGTSLIDISSDTVTADKLMQGYTAHDRTGALIMGTATGGSGSGVVWQDVQGYIHLSDEGDIPLQTKTVSPTETAQIVTQDNGYYALDKVNVGAISSSYVGSSITRRSSSDLTASGATVTAPAGYYENSATKSVTSGTAGTPTATKSAVNNHSVTVTPSVTNTTGYITGGTKTGTAVTVSASELVSGSQTITTNDTYNVTNLAEVVVSVSGGGSSYTFIASNEYTVSTSSTTDTTLADFDSEDTSIWTSDKMVYVKIRDKAGRRNGYYYGSDSFIINFIIGNGLTATSSYQMTGSSFYQSANGYLQQMSLYRASSSAAISGYGIYPSHIYNDGRITLRTRYSTGSFPTGTINGTFTVEVYLLDFANNISPFNG